ncbi:sensor histidine kinase [Gracilibacillus alcaliphilus]|uniref:sensor histidine kinase n=1 Tax=Gracilibacillus alcaliphilus TaxID=1401441 RepID=UPI001958CDE5|nr:sensor histidine kinase [Gracilibacillus alcaliphilus]MBM7678191.1 two-component system sensor histidine kinase YesM [Gracilibacillus alcaliphilus]
MSRLKQWFINLKFRKKILFICVIASGLPMMMLGSIWYYQVQEFLITREKENLAETLNQSIQTADYKIDNYFNFINQIAWNAEIRTGLTADYNNNFEMYQFYTDTLHPQLFTTLSLQSDIQSLTIYTDNQMHPYGQFLRPLTDIEDRDWFSGMVESKEVNMLVPAEEEFLKVLYRIFDSSSRPFHNVIEMNIDKEQFFAPFTDLFEGDYGLIILDSEDNPIYIHTNFANEALYEPFSNTEQIRELIAGDFDRQFVSEQAALSAYQWTAYLYRPMSNISSATFPMRLTVILAILLAVVVMVLSIFLLARVVVRPLEKLSKNMGQVEKGDLSVTIHNKGTDEIGSLIHQFGQMVYQLNHMINQVYKSKIAEQKYEMKALQAQINPHFFYNSLSLINSKAIMADQEEISQMAQHLSTFYRTTLNKGKSTIKVKNEIDNVKSYIDIQRLMHSNSFDVIYDIDQEIFDYSMLNLLLQPLIENAIVHGIDHKLTEGKGILELKAKQADGRLKFEIIDNGKGIDPATLATILTKKTKGYGVKNVHDRIQLYYGSDYGLNYQSELNSCTKVTLTIPVMCEDDS